MDFGFRSFAAVTIRGLVSPVRIAALLLVLMITASVDAETAWRWQPDEDLNGQRHGARGVWHDLLWGLDFLGGKIWAFDGTAFHEGGAMPGNQKPQISMFTDAGMFVLASNRIGEIATADILYSPDGFQRFETVLSVDSTAGGVPFAGGHDHSMVDLGDGHLMYFQYSDQSRVFHSPDAGQTWNLLFQPELGSIADFHGDFLRRTVPETVRDER